MSGEIRVTVSDCLSGLLLREPSANDLWQRPKLSVFTAVGCLISDLSAWKALSCGLAGAGMSGVTRAELSGIEVFFFF